MSARSPSPRIEASGSSLKEAYVKAAEQALGHAYALDAVTPETGIPILCESSDLEFLLADWINTLLYEIQHRRMLFSRFEIEVEGIHVRGKAFGEPYDPRKHEIRHWVSGVGFTDLSVQELPGSVRVSFVLDDPRHALKPGVLDRSSR